MTDVFSWGLNRMSGACMRVMRAGTAELTPGPADVCAAPLRSWLMAVTAVRAAKISVPSMSTWGAAPDVAGRTRATTASPRRSACTAWARPSPGCTATTSSWGGRRRATSRCPRPDDQRARLLDVEACRVAEDDQEQERQHEQHGQRAPVAAQLAELLDHDRPHGPSPDRTSPRDRAADREINAC